MNNEIILLPRPRKIRMRPGRHDLSNRRLIRLAPELRQLATAVRTLSDQLDLTLGAADEDACFARICFDQEPAAGAYALTVQKTGVTLAASDAAGAHAGLATLKQLMLQCGRRLPACTIEDRPAMARRGFMLDVSRCKVPTMEALRHIVDLLALFKYNELQLYTEHTFAYSRHEVVWGDSSPMTPGEIVELDHYCRDRGIELVPNQNSFGHMARWLKHPEYAHLAECPNGFDWPWGGRSESGFSLRPDKESLDFLAELYDELLPNFSSRYFNVGCDETWDLGQGRSKVRCEKEGKGRVYADFLLKIHKLTQQRERQMMFWSDIILESPELIPDFPKDIVHLVWGYRADTPFAEQTARFADCGLPFYVCPGTSAWNSITGQLDNCLANVHNAGTAGAANGALGYLNTDWGDGGHHQTFPISLPGMLAGAAAAWNPGRVQDQDLTDALSRFVFADASGVLAEVLLGAGRIQNEFDMPPGNSNIINRFVFWVSNKADVANCQVKQMTSAGKRCDQLLEQLEDARPVVADSAWLVEELRHSIGLARHGIHRALALRQARPDIRGLRRELTSLIAGHEELWLNRNRPGGLHESSARLRGRMPQE